MGASKRYQKGWIISTNQKLTYSNAGNEWRSNEWSLGEANRSPDGRYLGTAVWNKFRAYEVD